MWIFKNLKTSSRPLVLDVSTLVAALKHVDFSTLYTTILNVELQS